MAPVRGLLGALLFALCLACAAATATGDKDRFTVHDLHAMVRVGEAAVSPADGSVAYTTRVWDEKSDVTTTNLQLLVRGADGSYLPPRALTGKPGVSDFSPVFSPDGASVLFLSTRTGAVQLHSVPVGGAEADVTLFASFPVEISNLKWSPSGKFILFTAEVFPDCDKGAEMDCTAKRLADVAARGQNTGYLFSSLYVRHWDTWSTGAHSHIFKLDVSARADGGWEVASGALPVDLMQSMMAASPVPPFGGAEQFAVSPDGLEVAFTAEVIKHDTAWTTGWRVFTVALDGTAVGQPKSVSEFTQARTQNPAYSPDGSTIAFLTMNRAGFEADRLHIMLYDRATGAVRAVADWWDRSVSAMTWLPSGEQLLVEAEEDASGKVFVVDIVSDRVATVLNTATTAGALLVPGQPPAIAFVASRNSMAYPTDLWLFSFTPAQLHFYRRMPRPSKWPQATPAESAGVQLTSHNKDALSRLFMSEPKRFHFVGAKGQLVQGWVMPPYGYAPSLSIQWPAAHLVHGGPQGAWTDDWSYRWNPQLWASRGYAVYFINFHGSTGFGQDFTDSISGDWGGAPFEDLMKGSDYVFANFPWIDGDRTCSCGASYGGWMINWINGHTNRFKCLVNHDGMFDTFDSYFRTEELWFPEWEFKGLPWEQPELYEKFNPRAYVNRWKTPTLVVHGGKDFRLPSTGLATFTALQRQNIPSQLLYFPMENHWVLRPANGIMWYDNVLGWLDRWTGNAAINQTQAL